MSKILLTGAQGQVGRELEDHTEALRGRLSHLPAYQLRVPRDRGEG